MKVLSTVLENLYFSDYIIPTAVMEEELTEILDPTLSDDDSKVHNKLLGAVADLYEKKR